MQMTLVADSLKLWLNEGDLDKLESISHQGKISRFEKEFPLLE